MPVLPPLPKALGRVNLPQSGHQQVPQDNRIGNTSALALKTLENTGGARPAEYRKYTRPSWSPAALHSRSPWRKRPASGRRRKAVRKYSICPLPWPPKSIAKNHKAYDVCTGNSQIDDFQPDQQTCANNDAQHGGLADGSPVLADYHIQNVDALSRFPLQASGVAPV